MLQEAESKLKEMALRMEDEENKLITSGNGSISMDLGTIENDEDEEDILGTVHKFQYHL